MIIFFHKNEKIKTYVRNYTFIVCRLYQTKHKILQEPYTVKAPQQNFVKISAWHSERMEVSPNTKIFNLNIHQYNINFRLVDFRRAQCAIPMKCSIIKKNVRRRRNPWFKRFGTLSLIYLNPRNYKLRQRFNPWWLNHITWWLWNCHNAPCTQHCMTHNVLLNLYVSRWWCTAYRQNNKT